MLRRKTSGRYQSLQHGYRHLLSGKRKRDTLGKRHLGKETLRLEGYAKVNQVIKERKKGEHASRLKRSWVKGSESRPVWVESGLWAGWGIKVKCTQAGLSCPGADRAGNDFSLHSKGNGKPLEVGSGSKMYFRKLSLPANHRRGKFGEGEMG